MLFLTCLIHWAAINKLHHTSLRCTPIENKDIRVISLSMNAQGLGMVTLWWAEWKWAASSVKKSSLSLNLIRDCLGLSCYIISDASSTIWDAGWGEVYSKCHVGTPRQSLCSCGAVEDVVHLLNGCSSCAGQPRRTFQTPYWWPWSYWIAKTCDVYLIPFDILIFWLVHLLYLPTLYIIFWIFFHIYCIICAFANNRYHLSPT